MLAYKDTRIFTEAISGSQINRDGLNTLQLKIEKVMSFYTLKCELRAKNPNKIPKIQCGNEFAENMNQKSVI